eukprot:4116289-Amphidinium_carterae.1
MTESLARFVDLRSFAVTVVVSTVILCRINSTCSRSMTGVTFASTALAMSGRGLQAGATAPPQAVWKTTRLACTHSSTQGLQKSWDWKIALRRASIQASVVNSKIMGSHENSFGVVEV